MIMKKREKKKTKRKQTSKKRSGRRVHAFEFEFPRLEFLRDRKKRQVLSFDLLFFSVSLEIKIFEADRFPDY